MGAENDTLLAQFPCQGRALVEAAFAGMLRDGYRSPRTVVDRVRELAELRAEDARGEDERAIWRRLVEVIVADRGAALGYAARAVVRQAIGSHETLIERFGRASYHRRKGTSSKPPTERQIEYLRGLGYFDMPSDRQQASDLIQALRAQPHDVREADND